jgi:hypothetical protein
VEPPVSFLERSMSRAVWQLGQAIRECGIALERAGARLNGDISFAEPRTCPPPSARFARSPATPPPSSSVGSVRWASKHVARSAPAADDLWCMRPYQAGRARTSASVPLPGPALATEADLRCRTRLCQDHAGCRIIRDHSVDQRCGGVQCTSQGMLVLLLLRMMLWS